MGTFLPESVGVGGEGVNKYPDIILGSPENTIQGVRTARQTYL